MTIQNPNPNPKLERCVGCGALLPSLEGGPIHRYMTSSAACWAAFNSLGDLKHPLGGMPFDQLLVDAYAVQHPGTSSPQTINSAAIHLMVLYGVLTHNASPDQALWLRMRPGRPSRIPKHQRFHWLTPPVFAGLTISDVLAGDTPLLRSRLTEAWIREVWSRWAALHQDQVAVWFEKYVLAERF